jgi:serine O-acetyltransferase
VTSSADEVGLFTLVREDWETNGRDWTAPGFQALAVHRLGRHARRGRGPAARLSRIVYRVLFLFVRNCYGIEIPVKTYIGRRMRLVGQHGMVFNEKTSFGDDCSFGHNCTTGIGIYGKNSVPVFGDRVEIAPGVVVLGEVTIGDDVKIGPNALVITNVPDGAHVFEKPTRIMHLTRVVPAPAGEAGPPNGNGR